MAFGTQCTECGYLESDHYTRKFVFGPPTGHGVRGYQKTLDNCSGFKSDNVGVEFSFVCRPTCLNGINGEADFDGLSKIPYLSGLPYIVVLISRMKEYHRNLKVASATSERRVVGSEIAKVGTLIMF
ncbi:MAG: hypothetical protein WCQ00_02705 [bacterium]